MRRLMLALALVGAACGGAESGPAQDPTTTTSNTTSTTANTSTTSATTTTQPQGPLPIGDNTRFRADQAYSSAFQEVDRSYQLAFANDGWRVFARGTGAGRFLLIYNTTTSPGADVLLMAFDPGKDMDTLMSWFTEHPNTIDRTFPIEVDVGGVNASQADILVSPRQDGTTQRCNSQMLTVSDTTNLAATVGGLASMEVWGCTWSRVWTIDVEGVTITAVGMAHIDDLDPDQIWRIEDLQPLLDEFINAISFCTEATPCDD